jgi:hypothetical protein
MFWSYDHLQVDLYTVEINSTDNGSVVFLEFKYQTALTWERVWSCSPQSITVSFGQLFKLNNLYLHIRKVTRFLIR